MVTCPWCGTHYAAFQPNCQNCGGPLDEPAFAARQKRPGLTAEDREPLAWPPPPPRPIGSRYAWRLLAADGAAIAAGVFGLVGAIFAVVGGALTLGGVTAFVGLPFLLLGLVFLAAAGSVGAWRWQEAQKVVEVLRDGQAVEGQISQVEQNLYVQVNGRSPWVIRYRFTVQGQEYSGQVSTLNPPGAALQAGQRACALYLPKNPQQNTLYPRP